MVASEYLIFFLKVITVLIAVIIFLMAFFAIKSKGKLIKRNGNLVLTNLSEHFFMMKMKMLKELGGDKKESKILLKKFKKNQKIQNDQSGRIFLLKFKGDIRADAVNSLKHEISAILSVAQKIDSVVIVLESPGGAVSGYGLAASELDRFRKRGINLTVLIDKVAASGGYMMACTADKIIAAPFAIIGSIGVLAQIPNFNRLLRDKGVDFEQITSGKYKRTVTMFGVNTDQDRQKMQSDLDDIHKLFKNFIQDRRPNINIDLVSTGEFWLAAEAKNLGLVDDLMTSDDYLMQLCDADKKLFLVEYKRQESLLDKFSNSFASIRSMLYEV